MITFTDEDVEPVNTPDVVLDYQTILAKEIHQHYEASRWEELARVFETVDKEE